MKTVILSAGVGSRLQSILNGRPKPLFELGGKSLLCRSLDALAARGIDNVTLAVGFKERDIRKEIGSQYSRLKINYALNKRYHSTGSMHSLYLALGSPQDCLVLDGDIIYDSGLIQRILDSPLQNNVILSPCSGSGDEVYTNTNEEGRINYLGKADPGGMNLFEFTGISKFSKAFIKKMFTRHKNNLENKQYGEYYEDCAYQISKTIPWYGLITQKNQWSEIDKPEDVPRAMKVLKKQKPKGLNTAR